VFADEPAALYNLATAQRLAGSPQDALGSIEKVLKTAPGDAQAYQLRGLIKQDIGNLDGALADVDKALQLNGGAPETQYHRAAIQIARAEWADAASSYTAALKAYPGDAAIRAERGYAYFRAEADELALADARAALLLDNTHLPAHWLKASALLYLGRLEEALSAVADGLSLHPENPPLLVVQGRVLLGQGNPLGAIAVLTHALEIAPGILDARAYRAAAASRLGLHRLAQSELEAVLTEAPQSAAVLELMVEALQLSGDLYGALTYAGRLTSLSPQDANYRWSEGDLFARLGDVEGAISSYSEAVRLFGDAAPVELLRRQGAALNNAHRSAEAIPPLTEALRREPTNVGVLSELGVAQFWNEQYQAAIANLKRAAEALGNDEAGYFIRFKLASAYTIEDQWLAAIREYDALLALAPNHVDALIGRGLAKAELGRFEDANADAETALRLNARSADAFLLKHRILRSTGQAEAALAAADEAIELAPDLPRAYAARAFFHQKSGDLNLALGDLSRAIILAPDNGLYFNNRADVLLRLGQLQEARYDAERATELDPELAVGWVTLGQILLETGALAEAAAALDRAIALDYPGAEAYFLRAGAHAPLGEAELARRDLAKAAERDDGRFAEKIAALRLRLL
jgi:tetratricopeptide (TPR) repeat protein